MGFTAAFFTMLNGGHNGRAAMRANPAMVAAVFGGSLVSFYMVFARMAGYNSKVYNEF